ncbi:2-oxoglutarate dehydrogenase E1 subunit family protein [Glutamicibacter nicotianae]|uniref:2-oxoglutarate dehydrogenase E1 subunit family protein n=1 Tax=Glutamicibacter nicotianae TaxID=37929 RepID=UPI001CBE6A01|nr:hypothetical protein [Glutamicibacter nicotianae]
MPEQAHHRLTEEFWWKRVASNELFEQYLVDKNSVDKKWWDIFESLAAEKKDPPGSAAGTSSGSRGSTSCHGQGAPRAAAQARATEPAPAATAAPSPAAEAKRLSQLRRLPIPAQPRRPAATDFTAREAHPAARADEGHRNQLDASLTVPTATTVRAVPPR